MSTYKVIQDIEAEDKLVGPLSLRQFLYAIASVVGGYLCFLSIQKGAPFLLVVFAPITLIIAFFAVPWRKEQSTEMWALAHLRFFIKPHVRIWSQNGIREYVQVLSRRIIKDPSTANRASQDEVRSKLHALADTIDTRGWAVKGATTDELAQIDPLLEDGSDRLVGGITMPQEAMSHLKVTNTVKDQADILDDAHPVSKSLIGLIDRQAAERRERLVKQVAEQVKQPAEPEVPAAPRIPESPAEAAAAGLSASQAAGGGKDKWFMQEPGQQAAQATVITPGATEVTTAATEPSAAERVLAAQFKAQNQANQQTYYGHLHVVQPLSAKSKTAQAPKADSEPEPVKVEAAAPHETSIPHVDRAVTAPRPPSGPMHRPTQPVHARTVAKAATKAEDDDKSTTVTSQPDPAILEYASNDDLDIATISRQINKHKSPNEVEIRLH